jgi:hypothetical protein
MMMPEVVIGGECMRRIVAASFIMRVVPATSTRGVDEQRTDEQAEKCGTHDLVWLKRNTEVIGVSAIAQQNFRQKKLRTEPKHRVQAAPSAHFCCSMAFSVFADMRSIEV